MPTINEPEAPNEEAAALVAAAMTQEKVLSVSRLTTGDQHFVFAIKTSHDDYVLRLTSHSQIHKFISAIYWQKKFLPLGVPLATFIDKDIDGRFSSFPALLMKRLPGDDLCNIYSQLTREDKRNLAKEMVSIQKCCEALPAGSSFGILDTYESTTGDHSWYDFLRNRLFVYRDIIKKNGIFDENKITEIIAIADSLKPTFDTITSKPFLWDASERNVIVHQGKISGIVDVDEICFGDPLLVLGLTYTALELEGHDVLYCDYWAEALNLDKVSKIRLAFYRLFYVIVFIRKHAMITANQQQVMFNIERLESCFEECLQRLKSLM